MLSWDNLITFEDCLLEIERNVSPSTQKGSHRPQQKGGLWLQRLKYPRFTNFHF